MTALARYYRAFGWTVKPSCKTPNIRECRDFMRARLAQLGWWVAPMALAGMCGIHKRDKLYLPHCMGSARGYDNAQLRAWKLAKEDR